LVAGVTGRYFEDCQEAGPHVPGVRRGVAAYALDPDKAARLWQLSTDLLAKRIRRCSQQLAVPIAAGGDGYGAELAVRDVQWTSCSPLSHWL